MNLLLLFESDIPIDNALLISLIGIVLILLVLAVLMLVVKLMSLVIGKVDNKSVLPTVTPAASYTSSAAPAVSRSLVLKNVSEQDAALIMAIVAHQTNIPIEELSFKSITLLEDGK